MNHLAHFLLAADDDQSRMGTLLGDFVRGPDLSAWPPRVAAAIRLHRRVDSITDTHADVAAVKHLVDPPLRRYAGILLDVFFDHFLTAQWQHWHAAPLQDYCTGVYASLAGSADQMPDAAGSLARRMGEYDILRAAASRAGVSRVLTRIAGRLSRPVALADGVHSLDAHYAEFDRAFRKFFPELLAATAPLRVA
jgi:acyl carrier protein phosphodiesterase